MIKISKMPKLSISSPTISRDLNDIAVKVRELVSERTLSGVDVNHRQFIPYSDAYAKHKGTHGRVSSIVNLRVKGTLLEHTMKIANILPTLKRIFLGLPDRAFIGEIHQKGLGNMPERYWFGINQPDADKIYRKICTNSKWGVFL